MDDARIHITFDGIFLHLVERQDFAHQYLTQALLFDFFMDPSFNCPHQNFRDISGNTFFLFFSQGFLQNNLLTESKINVKSLRTFPPLFVGDSAGL